MHRRLCSGFLFVVLYGTVFASAGAETVYTIDPTRSELVVQLFKAGAGAAFAHDHVVRATTYIGQIHFDPTTLSSASVTVEVQVASLKADEPALRQKYNLTSQLSEKDQHSIQDTMLSASQLDAARYPLMKFSSTKIEARDVGTYTVTGNLTIRGISQLVTFPAQIERSKDTLRVRGSFRFTQSSFGYQPYSALFGAVRNQDEVLLHFDVVGFPSEESSSPIRGE
jgi:polyisoprenoid-binding protein YceI